MYHSFLSMHTLLVYLITKIIKSDQYKSQTSEHETTLKLSFTPKLILLHSFPIFKLCSSHQSSISNSVHYRMGRKSAFPVIAVSSSICWVPKRRNYSNDFDSLNRS